MSSEEVLAPLEEFHFHVEHHEIIVSQDPYYSEFQETKDLDTYADKVMNFFRSVSENSLASLVPHEQREHTVTEFYADFKEEAKKLPEAERPLVAFGSHLLILRKKADKGAAFP